MVTVNCSAMLYEWDGQDWVFIGVGRRVKEPKP